MSGVEQLPQWWTNPARAGVVWPTRAGGTPTRGEARGPHWRRTSQGFYVPAQLTETPEQRIAEARPLLRRSTDGVTGWAALRWLGAAWFDGRRSGGARADVPIVTGLRHRRPQTGFRISEERLGFGEVTRVDGLQLTHPVRSVAFAMRYAFDVRDAVAAVDMAAYGDLVSIAEVSDYLDREQNGWTGAPQARAALPLCDENAWSPTETTFRLIWSLDGGLPRPLTNMPVFDRRGNLIGVPDLIDPVAGVVGEYDGAAHLMGAQRARDVRREALFRSHGLDYVTMLSGDLSDPRAVVRRLWEAYGRAERLPRSARSWTIEQPSWWRPTHDVGSRRLLSAAERERLLRLRLRPPAA